MTNRSIFKSDEGKKQVIKFYDSLLEQSPTPLIHKNIQTTFGDTFILECGKKGSPSLFLLHGAGSNSAMWLSDIGKLSERYHVFAIDIIGECGKSSENRPPFQNGLYAEWIFEIIEKLSLDQITFIGCSLGGWIALDFAVHHPELTNKLVLIATAGITQVKLKTIFWIIITSMMGTWGFRMLNKMVYGNLSIDQKALEVASLVQKHYKPRTDVLPVLSNGSLNKINIPTLFIGGEHDCFYDSQKTASRLKENISNSSCLILKETGHIVTNHTNTILQFLNS